MKKAAKVWLEFAHRDLEAAKALIENEYIANVVLFHSPQCIEKCFKAILEEYAVRIPKIHSMVKLYSMVIENTEVTVSISEDELDLVDAVYIDTRYPGGLGMLPSGFPTKIEARALLEIAQKVYEETDQKLTS